MASARSCGKQAGWFRDREHLGACQGRARWLYDRDGDRLIDDDHAVCG